MVTTIQRAWVQLDIDTSLLLDSLGDADVPTRDRSEHSDLFTRLLQAGKEYSTRNPSDLSSLPTMEIDAWTTAEDVVAERKRVEDSIREQSARVAEELDILAGSTLDEGM